MALDLEDPKKLAIKELEETLDGLSRNLMLNSNENIKKLLEIGKIFKKHDFRFVLEVRSVKKMGPSEVEKGLEREI